MRVATVDGLVTLFYDGSKPLFDWKLTGEWKLACSRERKNWKKRDDIESLNISDECKEYLRERMSWHQIIIVEGVIEIPAFTFCECINIRRVIFADTVIRIGMASFSHCENLEFIRLSIRLEVIGPSAFSSCDLLSVFIPPTCREIGEWAFDSNKNLSILHVPQQTQLGRDIINDTKLLNGFPSIDDAQEFPEQFSADLNNWLKNVNDGNEYSLHRACSSSEPLKEIIHTIIEEKGLEAFKKKNLMGITPSRYLSQNPYTDITEMEVIRDYITKQMGEYV